MSDDDIEALRARLEQASADEDFELAARLRDELLVLTASQPGSKLRRQIPGAMGLGTDQQVMKPKAGWKPPKKPDMMTSNTKPRRGG